MSNYYKLGISPLDTSSVFEIINEDKNICLDNCLKEKIISCRKFLNKTIKSNDLVVEAANMMKKFKVYTLVVEDKKDIVGILSMHDILEANVL